MSLWSVGERARNGGLSDVVWLAEVLIVSERFAS